MKTLTLAQKRAIEARMKKQEAIENAEFHADGAPEWARARAEYEIERLKNTPAEHFINYNSCASPKESTELY